MYIGMSLHFVLMLDCFVFVVLVLALDDGGTFLHDEDLLLELFEFAD